ncbi:hypothetical protein PWT90_01541 [Aphanocladium album]|nr:hypothetical protein PWT90_01541 [Aphanocladium album]
MEKESRSSASPDAEEAKTEYPPPQQQTNDATSPAGVADAAAASPAAHEPAPLPKDTRRLPQWLDHFNRRDLTTLLRCLIAVWVASLLMLINPSLQRFGQSTFLAAIVLFIIPPAGNFFVALVGYLSLLFGMCLAWAWGLATMKAAQAARPAADTAARLQALRQEVGRIAQATGNNNTADISQKLVHDGFMLDARVTTVYFVMGCAFIYAVSRFRYTYNMSVLAQIFGIIATDIFIVIGPTLTKWTPTLAETVVLPAACGSAIGIFCILFILPQSSSLMALGHMQDMLAMLNYPIQTARQLVSCSLDVDANRLRETKQRVITLYAELQPNIAFLPVELSRGLWSCDDINSIHSKLRDVVASTFAMTDFQIARANSQEKADRLRDMTESLPSTSSDMKESTTRDPRRARILQNPVLINALISPGSIGASDDIRLALHDSSRALLDAMTEGISHLVGTFRLVNSNRWFVSKAARARLPQSANALRQISAKLSAARESCIAETTKSAIELHGNLFDENGLLKTELQDAPRQVAALFIAFVIEEHVITTSASFQALTDEVARLLESRTKVQVWLPSKLQAIFRRATSDEEASTAALPGQDGVDPDRIQAQSRETQRRIKVVSRGQGIPRKRGHPIARGIAAFGAWLTAPGSLYALRVVAATIALGIPAVLPNTAGFYYREKGLWALITAQTCILMYMSDFTFSILTRTISTISGGVISLVIWYIGAGNGIGNPYGLGAALPFGLVIFVYCRLWLPAAYLGATALGCATFILIIGYSWDMYHLKAYGLPGSGYGTFWKRLVMVLVGFAASLVVQMLPKPPSGTIHVAKSLANNLHTISDHYALLIAHWGTGKSIGEDFAGVRAVITKTGLGVAQVLSSLHTPIAMLKFETSTSPFDQATLRRAQELMIRMNQALTKLALAATILPMEYQQRLIKYSGIADDASISNIMSVLALTKQSLRNGGALPERLPTPLMATCYGEFASKQTGVELRREDMETEDFRRYCVALSSYLSFLHYTDELVELLKESVGESHVVHDWTELADNV